MISIPNKNPLAVLEDDKNETVQRLMRMENEMQDVFNRKVELKLRSLTELEYRLQREFDQSKSELEKMSEDLRCSRKAFDEEKSSLPFDLTSPTHSNSSSISSSTNKKIFKFNIFEQMKIK